MPPILFQWCSRDGEDHDPIFESSPTSRLRASTPAEFTGAVPELRPGTPSQACEGHPPNLVSPSPRAQLSRKRAARNPPRALAVLLGSKAIPQGGPLQRGRISSSSSKNLYCFCRKKTPPVC